jgi:archaellum biogenesis ATPase FlaH
MIVIWVVIFSTISGDETILEWICFMDEAHFSILQDMLMPHLENSELDLQQFFQQDCLDHTLLK